MTEYKVPHLPLTVTELVYSEDMPTTNEDLQEQIRERLWKNIGLASDIMEAIEQRDSVNESDIRNVLNSYTLASEADGMVDVFKTEMFRSVKCIKSLNENGTLEKERAEEMNESFEMLKEIAKDLDITIR